MLLALPSSHLSHALRPFDCRQTLEARPPSLPPPLPTCPYQDPHCPPLHLTRPPILPPSPPPLHHPSPPHSYPAGCSQSFQTSQSHCPPPCSPSPLCPAHPLGSGRHHQACPC